MLCTPDVGDKECEYGEHKCHSYIAGEVGAAGEYHNQPEQIHAENKEEHRKQIGRKFTGLVVERRFNHTVIYKCHESLDGTKPLARSLETAGLVMTGKPQKQRSHKNDSDEQRTHILGDGDVQGTLFLAVDNLDELAAVAACLVLRDQECGVAVLVHLTVGHTGRREDVQAVGAKHYYWQRNALVVVEGYFPAITVAEVLKYDFLGVDLPLFRSIGSIRRIGRNR